MEINCNNIKFEFKNSSPAQVINKYHVGKLNGDDFRLMPYEALYLYMKGKISPDTDLTEKEIINKMLSGDFFNFYVYYILKNLGFLVIPSGSSFLFKRLHEDEYRKLLVIKETDYVDFTMLFNEMPCRIITIDEEGGITYFHANIYDPAGKAENNNITFNDTLPEWFGNKMLGVKIFNSFEENYLKEKIESCYDVLYQDLISRNFIVKSGFKYGQNFRIYEKSVEEHAEFLVSFLDRDSWHKISRSVRLSHSVRKKTLLAGFINKNVEYIIIERIKDL